MSALREEAKTHTHTHTHTHTPDDRWRRQTGAVAANDGGDKK